MKEFFDKLIGKMNPPKEEEIKAIKEDDQLSMTKINISITRMWG